MVSPNALNSLLHHLCWPYAHPEGRPAKFAIELTSRFGAQERLVEREPRRADRCPHCQAADANVERSAHRIGMVVGLCPSLTVRTTTPSV